MKRPTPIKQALSRTKVDPQDITNPAPTELSQRDDGSWSLETPSDTIGYVEHIGDFTTMQEGIDFINSMGITHWVVTDNKWNLIEDHRNPMNTGQFDNLWRKKSIDMPTKVRSGWDEVIQEWPPSQSTGSTSLVHNATNAQVLYDKGVERWYIEWPNGILSMAEYDDSDMAMDAVEAQADEWGKSKRKTMKRPIKQDNTNMLSQSITEMESLVDKFFYAWQDLYNALNPLAESGDKVASNLQYLYAEITAKFNDEYPAALQQAKQEVNSGGNLYDISGSMRSIGKKEGWEDIRQDYTTNQMFEPHRMEVESFMDGNKDDIVRFLRREYQTMGYKDGINQTVDMVLEDTGFKRFGWTSDPAQDDLGWNPAWACIVKKLIEWGEVEADWGTGIVDRFYGKSIAGKLRKNPTPQDAQIAGLLSANFQTLLRDIETLKKDYYHLYWSDKIFNDNWTIGAIRSAVEIIQNFTTGKSVQATKTYISQETMGAFLSAGWSPAEKPLDNTQRGDWYVNTSAGLYVLMGYGSPELYDGYSGRSLGRIEGGAYYSASEGDVYQSYTDAFASWVTRRGWERETSSGQMNLNMLISGMQDNLQLMKTGMLDILGNSQSGQDMGGYGENTDDSVSTIKYAINAIDSLIAATAPFLNYTVKSKRPTKRDSDADLSGATQFGSLTNIPNPPSTSTLDLGAEDSLYDPTVWRMDKKLGRTLYCLLSDETVCVEKMEDALGWKYSDSTGTEEYFDNLSDALKKGEESAVKMVLHSYPMLRVTYDQMKTILWDNPGIDGNSLLERTMDEHDGSAQEVKAIQTIASLLTGTKATRTIDLVEKEEELNPPLISYRMRKDLFEDK